MRRESPPREISQRADRMAGASIAAATATMYPSDVTPLLVSTDVAATNVTIEIEP